MALTFELRMFGIASESGLFLFELMKDSTDRLLVLDGDGRNGKDLVLKRIGPSAILVGMSLAITAFL